MEPLNHLEILGIVNHRNLGPVSKESLDFGPWNSWSCKQRILGSMGHGFFGSPDHGMESLYLFLGILNYVEHGFIGTDP